MRFAPAFLACLLSGLAAGAEKTASIQWVPFTQGTENAAAKGKYVFVDIYTQWCAYCKQLDAVTYKAGPVIAELDRNFVSIKLDAESDAAVTWKGRKMKARDLVGLWQVDGFPTLIFLNAKGEIIGSYSSYAEPELMVKLLTYISSGARERKVSFNDYLKGAG
jgi:thioredoxin-related protein